jgi:hypothetical protein
MGRWGDGEMGRWEENLNFVRGRFFFRFVILVAKTMYYENSQISQRA